MLGFQGCVWAVRRAKMRAAISHASALGVAAHGLIPTGWSELRNSGRSCGEDSTTAVPTDLIQKVELQAETVLSSQPQEGKFQRYESWDGVTQFPYSDHCSFQELVQFLLWLPSVPVTFITPVPTSTGPFGYNGRDGIVELLEQSGAPAISYCLAVSSQGGQRRAPRRPQRTIRSSDVFPSDQDPVSLLVRQQWDPSIHRRLPSYLKGALSRRWQSAHEKMLFRAKYGRIPELSLHSVHCNLGSSRSRSRNRGVSTGAALVTASEASAAGVAVPT